MKGIWSRLCALFKNTGSQRRPVRKRFVLEALEDRSLMAVFTPFEVSGATVFSARQVLDRVALNPQPLPPREISVLATNLHFDAVALNPQPLPPRNAVLTKLGVPGKSGDGAKGLLRRHRRRLGGPQMTPVVANPTMS